MFLWKEKPKLRASLEQVSLGKIWGLAPGEVQRLGGAEDIPGFVVATYHSRQTLELDPPKTLAPAIQVAKIWLMKNQIMTMKNGVENHKTSIHLKLAVSSGFRKLTGLTFLGWGKFQCDSKGFNVMFWFLLSTVLQHKLLVVWVIKKT